MDKTIEEQLRELREENAKLKADIREARGLKLWQAVIYDGSGIIQTRVTSSGKVEDLVKSFDKSNTANTWVINALLEAGPDWYAEITHATMNVKETITRDVALSMSKRHKNRPVTRGQVKVLRRQKQQ